MIAGGAVVGIGAATAAVFGAMWYFGTGPQPAEALPDTTIAYVSVDIDPSGKQLLEAKEALEKFPFWNDQDISSKKDLREAVFDEVLAEAPCDLDYTDDVEPWLGDRAAAAAVDLGGDQPETVFVVQVKDADKAEAAFEKFADCEPTGEGLSAGWAISGEWAVLAETEEIATQVAEDAQDNPLVRRRRLREVDRRGRRPRRADGVRRPRAAWLRERWGSASRQDYAAASSCGLRSMRRDGAGRVPDELTTILEDFSGAALTVRFDDGAAGGRDRDQRGGLRSRGSSPPATTPGSRSRPCPRTPPPRSPTASRRAGSRTSSTTPSRSPGWASTSTS